MLKRPWFILAVLLGGTTASYASCGQFELLPDRVWQVRNSCDTAIAVSLWDQGACRNGCTLELAPRSTIRIDPPQGHYTWTEQKRGP